MEEDQIKIELLEMFHHSVHLLHRSGPHLRRRRNAGPMPPAQGRLLRLLASVGPVTQRQLAEMLDMRSASLSELLNKLEKPGWIRRRPNEEDKRTIDIMLTEEGENMLRSVGDDRAEMAEEVFGSLSQDELVQLHSLLGKLIGDWETRFDSGEEDSGRGRFGRGGGRLGPGHGPGFLQRLSGHFHHPHGPHERCGFRGPCDRRGFHGREGFGSHQRPGGYDQPEREGQGPAKADDSDSE
ncbi:MAG: MarR family transcriptional regulator [Candidatus Adiutrix sp.]|jgi:DNA-binding MarR family transcriptional regulator|nr:MarR family transcriptional regulator [Candidatus Adiutrix sp.]